MCFLLKATAAINHAGLLPWTPLLLGAGRPVGRGVSAVLVQLCLLQSQTMRALSAHKAAGPFSLLVSPSRAALPQSPFPPPAERHSTLSEPVSQPLI